MDRTETSIRGYFLQIQQQMEKGIRNTRSSFPEFCEKVRRVVDECKTMIDETFKHSEPDSKKQFFHAGNLAHRLGALKELFDNPVPGRSFNANQTITEEAFAGIEQALLHRFEINIKTGDEQNPEVWLR